MDGGHGRQAAQGQGRYRGERSEGLGFVVGGGVLVGVCVAWGGGCERHRCGADENTCQATECYSPSVLCMCNKKRSQTHSLYLRLISHTRTYLTMHLSNHHSQVRVKFARRTSGIPGVAGRPEPRYDDDTTVKEVRY